ncbi:MAG: DUF3127 domain-containing protein [Flavobacteriaceae bacterium]|jgi:hypothetical protein|nr:DUF3127 domain-containing protein [Flavobacteriaceae bacterium]MBT6447944.1 DUF3127 domain-containing protein [Flavobacteriaceae bacterium]MDG1830495.1 DUF3127 domain-containing protein [Flavobacteriaceae bacterium]
MDISGKIKLINEAKEYGNNSFRKREVVITTEEQYPQDLLVEFVQDKCEILNSFQVGQSVKIDINLRGREWESPQGEIKYFNSIQGWRIEKLFSEDENTDIPPVPPAEAFQPADELNQDEPDDLPF